MQLIIHLIQLLIPPIVFTIPLLALAIHPIIPTTHHTRLIFQLELHKQPLELYLMQLALIKHLALPRQNNAPLRHSHTPLRLCPILPRAVQCLVTTHDLRLLGEQPESAQCTEARGDQPRAVEDGDVVAREYLGDVAVCGSNGVCNVFFETVFAVVGLLGRGCRTGTVISRAVFGRGVRALLGCVIGFLVRSVVQ
jgi:hypothetical protein